MLKAPIRDRNRSSVTNISSTIKWSYMIPKTYIVLGLSRMPLSILTTYPFWSVKIPFRSCSSMNFFTM